MCRQVNVGVPRSAAGVNIRVRSRVTHCVNDGVCVQQAAAQQLNTASVPDSPAREDKHSTHATTRTQAASTLKGNYLLDFITSLSPRVSSVSVYLERHAVQRGTTLRGVWPHCFLGIVIRHTHTLAKKNTHTQRVFTASLQLCGPPLMAAAAELIWALLLLLPLIRRPRGCF